MDLHNKDIWDFRAIIKENNTKYGSHKIITSFTPSIPLVLLELGVEPFDELCTKPIYWLKNNFDNGWNLPVYGERGLTFVYALGLWTILAWNREIMNRMICSSFENNILVNLRKRIKLLLITILSLLILISRDYLFNLVYFIIIYVYNYYAKNDIFTFLATFITIVSGLIAIPKGLSILDKKYLNCACEGKIKDVADELMRRLYLK